MRSLTAFASFGVCKHYCSLSAELRATTPPIQCKSRQRGSFLYLESSSSSNGNFDESLRQLVIFRPPSRHTYGFVDDPSQYDLPQLELEALIRHICDAEVYFTPVCNNSKGLPGFEYSACRLPGKKIRSHVQKSSLQVQSLYWVEGVPSSIVAKAVSRSILSHASFEINETHKFLDSEWSTSAVAIGSFFDAKIEVIDMTNPNMSLNEKTELLQQISSLLCNNKLWVSSVMSAIEKPIIIHHSSESENNNLHIVHFGKRTAIGLAGTQGAPSQTLRRTHRGILKDFALKQRVVRSAAGEFERSSISTAMEPEIGFLMANLALANKVDTTTTAVRVLDPCCGSGSLLLYASALERILYLVGVDADPSVWIDAEIEFKRRNFAEPLFVKGDIFDPSLMSLDYFDAIVCDPPYNIGAPVIVDEKDLRPTNHHLKNHEQPAYESIANSNHAGDKDITASIIHLAGRVLSNGGRISFFVPMKGVQAPSAVHLYKTNIESERLSLVFERKQLFSPTFSRWLVCLEKSFT